MYSISPVLDLFYRRCGMRLEPTKREPSKPEIVEIPSMHNTEAKTTNEEFLLACYKWGWQ